MTAGKSFYDRQGFFNLCLLGQRPTPGLPRRLVCSPRIEVPGRRVTGAIPA